jgi:Ca2+-binding RTX toxin-like protein
MSGGAGDDTYYVDSATDVVTEASNAGTDLVLSSVSYTLNTVAAVGVENLTLGGSTAGLTATGNALANTLTANSAGSSLYGLDGADNLVGGVGADVLDGGIGADTMAGGAGSDTYYVDSATDVVTEAINAGTDLVVSSVSYTLGTGSHLENLTLSGSTTLSGTGNELANTLTANSAGSSLYGLGGDDTLVGGISADVLDGGLDSDTMSGGAGDDTYYVDSATDVVTEASNAGTDLVLSSVSYTLNTVAAVGVENLTLSGSTAGLTATGNALANTLTANSAGSSLYGLDGADNLVGGLGIDTLIGGLGNDTYYVNNLGDIVSESANEGTDTVYAFMSYVLASGNNIENLALSGSGSFSGTGNELDNTIVGNSGANTLSGGLGADILDGGLGADTMIGGAGDDTYYVDSATDVVTEAINAGTDLVVSSVSYTLGTGSHLENLTLSGSTTLSGTGNELANTLTANSAGSSLYGLDGDDTLVGGLGADVLDGGLGSDTMSGGAGNDTYYVDSATDVVTEALNAGTDLVITSIATTLSANVENLKISGNTAAITVSGNTLDNTMTGSTFADTMSGGGGNDNLAVTNLSGTYSGDAGTDTLSIGGLVAGSTLSLSSLVGKVSTMEVIDVKDSVNEFISVGASAIQSIVGNGNSSALTLRLDAGDTLSVASGNFFTFSFGTSTYNFYNSDPGAGGATLIAQLSVTTA